MNEAISEIWTPERKALALACCNKWRGTKHVNRIAVVGVGIDCVKLLNEILVDSQIVERHEFGGYDVNEGMHGASDTMKKIVESSLYVERVEVMDAQFGDIAVFKNGVNSGHCAFVADEYIWHALARQNVTKTQFKLWKHEMQFIYRLTKTGWKMNPQEAINL